MLQSIALQRAGHDSVTQLTELNQLVGSSAVSTQAQQIRMEHNPTHE